MLTVHGKRFIFATIYRPGSDPVRNSFFVDFSQYLELLSVYNCHVVVLGDVNIHLDVTGDSHTTKFIDILNCFGFSQTVQEPTHTAGHTLDIVLVKTDNLMPVKTTIHPPSISDHSVIVTSLPVDKPHLASFSAVTRAWNKQDREAFRKDLLSSTICSDEVSDRSIDELVEDYNSVLTELLNKHAPSRTVHRHYRPITPWYNSACRAQKQKTRCLERRYRRTKSAVDKVCWQKQTRSAQEFFKQTQDIYWQVTISETAGNARKLWNKLPCLMGNKKKSPVQEELSADKFLQSFKEKVDDVRFSTSGSPTPQHRVFSGIPLNNFFSSFKRRNTKADS